jgi:LmbE family N-acetylglucosaminyl deacetylase
MLVVLAHPDDESYGIGGTLAKYAALGVHITLICATRGEAGIPGMTPNAAADVREHELQNATKMLGIHDVWHMGYPDGGLSKIEPEAVISRLADAMRLLRPQVVITFGPDGISAHPDHIAIHHLTTAAFDRAGVAERLFYIAPSEATQQGCGVTPTQEIAGGSVAAIDVDAQLVTKVRAAQCHTSQNPPWQGDPETAAQHLACHEYFTLARPAGPYSDGTDLFAPLRVVKPV